jgi:ParB family chromosome partitioning protein
MALKKGLGRGFDSLVPQGTSLDGVITPKTEKVHQLAIDVVRPKTNQPRQHFDEQLLDQLAMSIKEQGILQPIVVTEVEHNLYSIVAGERRWRAAQLAGLKNVPAIIKQVDELQHLELSLLENVQRSDLNAIETAKTIKRLHDDFQQSYESIAQHLGKAYTTVINAVRLLQLPETMQQAVIKGEITEGHARTLLSLAKHPTAQAVLFKDIITKKLSVRQAETIAAKAKLDALQTISKKAVKESATADVSQQLSKHLGVRVNMSKSKTKGKITLSYTSEKEFNRLVQRLES